MKKAAMCIAQNRSQADDIVTKLQSQGFSNSDISVL